MNLSAFKKLLLSCFLGSGFLASVLFAQAEPAILPNGSTVANWTVPPFHSSSAEGALTTMTDISPGTAFVAMVPCRVFDTRNAVGPYGGPRLLANVTRNFDIDSGPCSGIPPFAGAYSMSFGAILPDGANSFITIWPTGQAQPLVSSINPIQGAVVANAAIVPAGTNGSISVFPNTGVHLYGDINGYFPVVFNAGTGGLDIEGNIPGGAMAFIGNFDGSSEASVGIYGLVASDQFDTAGVLGRTGFVTPNPASNYFAAGVRGEGRTGVIGVGGDFLGGGDGVAGSLVEGAFGNEITYGALGTSFGTDPGSGAPPWAVFGGGNIGASGTKHFLDPHPSDPKLLISYVSLEGPEAGTYFRGRARFQNGMARIPVPEHFRLVTDPEGLTVQITPIGAMASFAVMRMDLNEIVVQASRNVEFSYLVQGVRATFKDLSPLRSGGEFMPRFSNSRMPEWLSPGQKRLLVQNGTYREDGTVNMETAHRLGWDKVWEQRSRPVPQPERP
jgi:hypothetical protein